MRALTVRCTWAGAAVVGLGLMSLAGCKTGPGWAMWGKKDGQSLAATKPSSNFPAPPSGSATPNPTLTAAGRTGGPGAGAGAGANAGYPTTNSGNSLAGARSTGGPGAGSPPGGYAAGGYPTTTAGMTSPAGRPADRGFYSASPAGANAAPGKFGGANTGYGAAGTSMERNAFDYQSAGRGDAAGGSGAEGAVAYPGADYPATARATPASGASPGYPQPQRNPYAAPPGAMPSSVRPPTYGPTGREDSEAGHNHSHSDSEFPAGDSYGSPARRGGSFDSGDKYAPPSSTPAFGGGYSSKAAATPGRDAALPMPSNLSQRGSGYSPGSTRRASSGPGYADSTAGDSYADTTAVKPATYNRSEPITAADATSDEPLSGGGFNEPSDSYPAPSAPRTGGSPGGSFYEK